jgi:hypothetical protein
MILDRGSAQDQLARHIVSIMRLQETGRVAYRDSVVSLGDLFSCQRTSLCFGALFEAKLLKWRNLTLEWS